MAVRAGYKQTPEHIAKRIKSGKDHQNWIGDAVSEKGGRTRAERIYQTIGPCQSCGAEKSERHHRDGNTANNEPENIGILCRKCHMREDGRLAKMKLGLYDKSKPRAPRKLASHCKRGHPMSGENLYLHKGKRQCKECVSLHALNYRNRRKESE